VLKVARKRSPWNVSTPWRSVTAASMAVTASLVSLRKGFGRAFARYSAWVAEVGSQHGPSRRPPLLAVRKSLSRSSLRGKSCADYIDTVLFDSARESPNGKHLLRILFNQFLERIPTVDSIGSSLTW
jgi:hypothetical protein